MAPGARKKNDKTIFESIRKPTAPASKRFKDGQDDRRDVVQRKAKHKKKVRPTDTDADI
jgi:hypothetical protein